MNEKHFLKIIAVMLLFLLVGCYSITEEALTPALAKAEAAGPIGKIQAWYAAQFHNLDGSFSNGWVYKEGKIVGRVESFLDFFKKLPQ